ncbi:MAG: hypothetical protein ACK5NK_07910 [Niabella sp.]
MMPDKALLSTLDVFDSDAERDMVVDFSQSTNNTLSLYLMAGGGNLNDLPMKKVESFIQDQGLIGKSYNAKSLKKLY